jgi:hypothetical protein
MGRLRFDNRRALLFAAGVACNAAPVAHARTVVLNPAHDNTLIGPNGALSNGAGPGVFCGATSEFGPRRAVLQFAVFDSIPADSKIDHVRLRLHLNRSASGATEQALHRVLRSWGEAGSFSVGGGGALADSGDATWTFAYFDSVPWTAPGGDFVPAPSASADVDSAADYLWGDTPQLVADVQAWTDHPDSNFGWILIGDEKNVSAKRYDSRESTTPDFRPRLEIDFSPPTRVEPASWTRWKQRFRSRSPVSAPKQVKR